MGTKRASPAAPVGCPVSGGFDALQVERLAVTPERVQLRDFRALEAIALSGLQAVRGRGRRAQPCSRMSAYADSSIFSIICLAELTDGADLTSFWKTCW